MCYFSTFLMTKVKLMSYLPTWMQKSPRIVPGLDSAGLVSPNITLPVLTTFIPSQTFWNKTFRLDISFYYSAVTEIIYEEWNTSNPFSDQSLYHGNNRTGAHVADKPREERSVFEVIIMLPEQLLRCLWRATRAFIFQHFLNVTEFATAHMIIFMLLYNRGLKGFTNV